MKPSSQIEFVQQYNWDDGIEPMRALLSEDNCAFEAALLAYWLAEGPWHRIGEISVEPEHDAFLTWLASRLEGGVYTVSDEPLNISAIVNLSKVQLHQLRASGLPEVFFGASVANNSLQARRP